MYAGALVNGTTNTQALSPRELEALSRYLAIVRSDEQTALYELIAWLLNQSTSEGPMNTTRVIHWSIYHFLSELDEETGEGSLGLLAARFPGEPFHPVSEQELKTLRSTLTTLRMKSWFADWLSDRVEKIDTAGSPAERCPDPLTVMGSLTLYAEQFQEQKETAQEFVALRPDLFAAAAAPPTHSADAPIPPAVPTPTRRSAAAVLGRRGGKARAARLSKTERSDQARKAVSVRWSNSQRA